MKSLAIPSPTPGRRWPFPSLPRVRSRGRAFGFATRPWLIYTGEHGGSGPPGKARGPASPSISTDISSIRPCGWIIFTSETRKRSWSPSTRSISRASGPAAGRISWTILTAAAILSRSMTWLRDKLIFSRGFDTYFGEYQTTDRRFKGIKPDLPRIRAHPLSQKRPSCSPWRRRDRTVRLPSAVLLRDRPGRAHHPQKNRRSRRQGLRTPEERRPSPQSGRRVSSPKDTP